MYAFGGAHAFEVILQSPGFAAFDLYLGKLSGQVLEYLPGFSGFGAEPTGEIVPRGRAVSSEEVPEQGLHARFRLDFPPIFDPLVGAHECYCLPLAWPEA